MTDYSSEDAMKRTFWMTALAGTLLFAAQGISDTATSDAASGSCSVEECGLCPGPCPLPCADASACALD
jgi:hypothetical protein